MFQITSIQHLEVVYGYSKMKSLEFLDATTILNAFQGLLVISPASISNGVLSFRKLSASSSAKLGFHSSVAG